MAETVGKSPSWAEQFSATHPVENLPQESRALFQFLLDHRAGIISYYEAHFLLADGMKGSELETQRKMTLLT